MHKGFVIVPRAFRLKGALGWSSEVDLDRDAGGEVLSTPFSIVGTYPTEQDALVAASSHGRMKINSGFAEHSRA
jgi:hypothetical protein